MDDVLILAQSVIDEGFCADGFSCWAGYGLVGIGLVALGFLVSRTRQRSEEAYWRRKQLEADIRANDPDMAKPQAPGPDEPTER